MEHLLTHGDNQQERFLEWLGGIIDGEGCITFRTRWQRHRFLQITPMILIVNTSKVMIDEIKEGLEKLRIPFWMTTKHPQNTQVVYHLEISGIKRVARFLPYMRVRAKREHKKLIQSFTESRLKLVGKEKTPYTQEELQYVKTLAGMYTRKNPQRLYARLLQHQGE